MLKQSLFVLLASAIVVLLLTELAYVLFFVSSMHFFIAKQLAKVFAGGMIGNIIRDSIALFIIPFIIALIPSLIYWAATRAQFKYFTPIIWVSWIILATLLVSK